MRTLILAASVAVLLSGAGAAFAQTTLPDDILRQWDKDGDNAISKDEWIAAGRPPENFEKVDADKDGKIVLKELAAAIKAMQQQRQGK